MDSTTPFVIIMCDPVLIKKSQFNHNISFLVHGKYYIPLHFLRVMFDSTTR